jgi:hypothetical protein
MIEINFEFSPEIGSTDLFTNKDVFLIKLPKEVRINSNSQFLI